MTRLLLLTLLLPLFSFSQRSKITLHNKGRYVTQTGYLVEGYKEGKWLNIDRRGDTSVSYYQKDKLILQRDFIKKTYGKYKGKTIISNRDINYNKFSKSEFLLKMAENKVYGLEKNITCPYYSKPYYKFYIQGDSKVTKSFIQQFDLTMLLYPLKDYYGTKYDRDLKPLLPQYGKVDFVLDARTGKRKINNVVVNYGSTRIFQNPEEQRPLKDNIRYSIEVSDSHFFTEKTTITVKKNNKTLFIQTFDAGFPSSYNSFHDNGSKYLDINYFKGLPHGVYQSFYDNGKLMVSCEFDEGVLNGDFEKYNSDGTLKFRAPLTDGILDGIVSGGGQALYFKNRILQQLIKLNDNKEIIKWKSGYNTGSVTKSVNEIKVDHVRYKYDVETKKYTEFNYGVGDYHFRYANYLTQNMIIVNLHNNKDNWFSLYVTNNQEIKDDINVTVDGKNYRSESKKFKLKLIEKHFMKLSMLRYPDFVTVDERKVGDTLIKSTFFPNGVKCLEEKFVNGKLTGTRKMWSYEGKLLQVSNYLNNHNEGLYVSYTPKGKIIEKGNYISGTKNGTWFKREREVNYEYIYDDNNTAKIIKSYYESGKIKSIYKALDSNKISEDFDEKGNRIKLNIRNFKGKLHGEYKTTYKGKTYTGYYLNGYKHGVFETFNEKGKLEATQNYEYGRIIKNPTREERNAICKCPQEFNIINGGSFYNPMKSFINYTDFSLYFKELLSISEEEYNKFYTRGFQNSYSRNNVSRFYGFDMIVLSSKKSFKLLPYKGVELLLTPCLNTGETGYRNVTLNTEKPLEAYRYEFDTDEPFEMTSKNMFKLLLEMSRQDFEEFISSNYQDMNELGELVKYLNKKGFTIQRDEDLYKQIELITEYIDENDKEEEFFQLFFKKEFDFGKLDEKKNTKGYRKFNSALNKFFRSSTNLYSISQVEKQVLTQTARFTINGGRFAIQHPLLLLNNKPSSIYFNCKTIQAEEKIVFKGVSKACIEPDTKIKGSDLTIESLIGLSFNNQSYGDNIELNFIGYIKGMRKSINFQLDINRSEILGFIKTNQFSEKQLKKVLKQTKGKLIDNDRTIRFVVG